MSDTVSEADSGLGFVRVNKMNILDTLPCSDYHRRGVRMDGIHNHIIKVYIRNPVNGDVFSLLVPFDVRVGPRAAPVLVGGLSFDDSPDDGNNLKAIVSEYTGESLRDMRLMFKQELLKTDSSGINSYNICHGSTISILFRTKRKTTIRLASSVNRVFARNSTYTDNLCVANRSVHKVPLKVMPHWGHCDYPGLFDDGGMLAREPGKLNVETTYSK